MELFGSTITYEDFDPDDTFICSDPNQSNLGGYTEDEIYEKVI